MKSILFIDLHREGRSPSQRFRYEQYLPILKQRYRVSHSYLLDEWADKQYYAKGKLLLKSWILIKSIAIRCKDLLNADNYDFIFIQREAFMLGTPFFEKQLARSKAKIIFDFDDAIWLEQISSNGPNNNLNFLKNPEKTSKIISVADIVVAGNEYLANYALPFNSEVRLIPTSVDTDRFRPNRENEKPLVCIGWSGSHSTIDHFTHATPALEKIKKKYASLVTIQVIGDDRYTNTQLQIQGKAWNINTEVSELQKFDIGIMPLPEDEWTKGKCGLKGLLYMALGIPAVMSPVGVNNTIIQHGKNGYLAESTDQWVYILSQLIEDSQLRSRIGIAGRKTVIDYYSVSANVSKFLKLFS